MALFLLGNNLADEMYNYFGKMDPPPSPLLGRGKRSRLFRNNEINFALLNASSISEKGRMNSWLFINVLIRGTGCILFVFNYFLGVFLFVRNGNISIEILYFVANLRRYYFILFFTIIKIDYRIK